MSTRYTVIIGEFAESHYLKNFVKKYKSKWEVTWRAISEELQRFDSLLDTTVAEVITKNDNIRIAKIEFKIAGTCESRKSSGNRCIISVCENTSLIKILLIYHKNDLGDKNETTKWKQIIKENYPEYSNLF